MSKQVMRSADIGNNTTITWTGQYFILHCASDELENKAQTIVLNIDTWLALTRFVKSLEND